MTAVVDLATLRSHIRLPTKGDVVALIDVAAAQEVGAPVLKSQLKRVWDVYFAFGIPFFVVKIGALSTWVVFGTFSQPNLPWGAKIIAFVIALGTALLGCFASLIAWPYDLFIWLAEGTDMFLRAMLYPWRW